jgi:SEC-C motif-containing protein
MTDCPCGSGKPLENCCGPYIDGSTTAPTAEATMRSRYTAHVMGKFDYLAETLSQEQLADYDKAEAEQSFGDSTWLGLEIRNTEAGGETDEAGTVEFVARYRTGNQRAAHHELSFFTRADGRGVFSGCEMNPTGPTVTVEKVGRNELCPCGSGKKFKKCHGA